MQTSIAHKYVEAKKEIGLLSNEILQLKTKVRNLEFTLLAQGKVLKELNDENLKLKIDNDTLNSVNDFLRSENEKC